MFQQGHRSILFFFILGLLLLTTNLQARQLRLDIDTLLVGVAGSEPFVYGEGQDVSGISVEIWEELAAKQGWNYYFKSFNTVDDALHSLEQGALDIVIGPISITSNRVEKYRFSQPFYNSSLAIVSRSEKQGYWDKIKPFFSIKLLIAVFVFLFILAIVGTMLWLAERNHSKDQFPNDPIDGIGNGMWLAIVTMSTTGYGDKAPITLTGRIIAGSWMIISIIFATSMVAGIASTLTLSSLGKSPVSNIEQLVNKNVATISNSPSQIFLKERYAKPVEVFSLEEAISKLKKKEVAAVVYDRPQLLFYLKNHGDEDLFMAEAEYYKQGYGFAFPLQSNLVYEVNRALLELAEDQDTDEIIDRYLKRDE
ncbi:transporter substrate-binding domain-containing protein [uncultured Cyclobacterium sp.]|uniref:transporter substrate-binding domain-containing protein n=1 Tax=uncultured Cyclobacterium sp. TaxID=453820 RepID=UPI0030ED2DCF|tara:strand:- start:8133 stop:9230 length:1098 start_codon:yes stop_codon:yes gene_type:complete